MPSLLGASLHTPPLAAPREGAAPVNLLGNLDTFEVSLVSRAANGRPFALAKGAPPMPAPVPVKKEYMDLFSSCSPLEQQLLDAAGGDKLTSEGREAVLLAARALAHVGAELKPDLALAVIGGMLRGPAPAAPPAPIEKADPATPAAPAADAVPAKADPATPAPPPAAPAADPATAATAPAAPAEKDGNQPAAPAQPEGEQVPTLTRLDGETDEAYAKRVAEAKAAKEAAAMPAPAADAPAKADPAMAPAMDAAAKGNPGAGDVHVPTTEKAAPVEKADVASSIAGVSKAQFDALPDAVRKAFEAQAETIAKQARVAKAAAFSAARAGFVAKAAKFKALKSNADTLGELLHTLHTTDAALAGRVEAEFERANGLIEKSGILDERGTEGTQADTGSGDPLEEIEALAKEHVAKEAKAGRRVSLEKARTVVYKERPDLYSRYDAARPGSDAVNIPLT